MKVIELTQNRIAVVDDEDFERLAQWRWCYSISRSNKGYAARGMRRNGTQKKIKMHREIMSPIPKGMEVDHINGDTLDNRRCNLRLCTHAQNNCNTDKYKTNTSGAKGVHRGKSISKPYFVARIQVNRDRKYLGCFPTLEEAKAAYDKAALELHGAFARLN